MFRITRFIFIFLFFISGRVFASNAVDTLLYQQKVTRSDVMFRYFMKENREVVYLSDQNFTFKIRRGKNDWMNFSIPYSEIRQIKRSNIFIFPNQITVLVNDGKKYKLGTYRRRKIIEFTRKRISLSLEISNMHEPLIEFKLVAGARDIQLSA